MLAEILLFMGKNASVPATVSVHGTHAMRSKYFQSPLHADEIWKALEGGRPTPDGSCLAPAVPCGGELLDGSRMESACSPGSLHAQRSTPWGSEVADTPHVEACLKAPPLQLASESIAIGLQRSLWARATIHP